MTTVALAPAGPTDIPYIAALEARPDYARFVRAVSEVEHLQRMNDRDFRYIRIEAGNGKIVGFAVDSEKRSPLAPNIPTFREIGYTSHIIPSNFGLYAPAGTPKAIIDKVNKGIVKVASNPEFQKRHMELRGLAPVLNSPEEFAKELDGDRAEGLSAIKGSGLYPDVK